MTEDVIGTHNGLHSEQGALPGEQRGRSANPVIKVQDVVWLEFVKPDLVKAEAFAHAFGFSTVLRTDEELHLRGSDASAPCVLIRKGPREKFLGPAFVAAEQSDLLRLADATGTTVRPLPETLGGVTVDLVDPSGLPVRVVSGTHRLEALPTAQTLHMFNFGHDKVRTNATQRPPRVPTNVQRLGHIVVQTPKYLEALNWYLDTFGMIVSDFSYYPGQRERGPILSFVRCDRGSVPADHHTLAMALGPVKRYMHSAYEVADLDALAAGGEHLREQGYFRSWGIGRQSKAARSSTIGVTPTVSWSSIMPTATCSTTPWSPAGRDAGLRPVSMGTSAEQGLPGCRITSGNRERARLDGRRATPRQRIRPVRITRLVQRRRFQPNTQTQPKERRTPIMTISILRTADAWWVQTAADAARIDTDATTTRELLADRSAIDAAAKSSDTVPVDA